MINSPRKPPELSVEETPEPLGGRVRRRSAADRRMLAENASKAGELLAETVQQLEDASPDVRLAGVHALERLADEDEAVRQPCIDVLCAAVRAAPETRPELDGEAGTEERLQAWRGERGYRRAVLDVIIAHLRDDAAVSWRGYDLDFTGIVIDGLEASGRSEEHTSELQSPCNL